MAPSLGKRFRWTLKTALASSISRAHDCGLARALARNSRRPLILGYHRVVDNFDALAGSEMPSMLVSRAMFERHLDYIGRRFQFVTLDEIGERLQSGARFERPVAAVTFDDGYEDVYEHAFPLLERKGIPAAVFVVTDLVGRPLWQAHDQLYHLVTKAFAAWPDPRHQLWSLLGDLGLPADAIAPTTRTLRTPLCAVSALLPALTLTEIGRLMQGLEAAVGNGFCNMPRTLTWPMLARMQRGGITIGSHTRNHVALPMEPGSVMADELEGSKRELERRLGTPVRHFAYPGGQFTKSVVEAVRRAGYQYAYTACPHGDARHPELTIERLLLWERSSVDATGRFSPPVLNCQIHDLWPPARTCGRVHDAVALQRGDAA